MTKLIVLEGPDCVGKTTTRKVIERQLEILGKTYANTVHPGDAPAGPAIRNLFKDRNIPLATMTRVYLIAANRVEMLKKTIQTCKKDYLIIDRFDLTTVIYQSVGMMIEEKVADDNLVVFEESFDYIFKLLVEDIGCEGISEINYIVLDNTDDVLDERLKGRELDSVELLGSRFHALVRKKFRDVTFVKDFIYRYPCPTTLAFTTTNSMEDIQLDMETHVRAIINN